MAEKNRTILMGEGASSETKSKKPLSHYLRARQGGFGGTIGTISSKSGDSKAKVKWKAGIIRGASGATRLKKSDDNKLFRKSIPGFKFEVKF